MSHCVAKASKVVLERGAAGVRTRAHHRTCAGNFVQYVFRKCDMYRHFDRLFSTYIRELSGLTFSRLFSSLRQKNNILMCHGSGAS